MTIYGKRVELRPLGPGDAQFLSHLDADPTVRSNVVGWGWPESAESCEERLGAAAELATVKRWLVLEQNSALPLGITGLWQIDWRNGTAEIGIKLGGDKSNRGKGYGTDTILALSAFAFLDVGLRRLYATVLATNEKSIRMFAEHCGWTLEATLRQHVVKGQRAVDCHIFGLMVDEARDIASIAPYFQTFSEQG